MPPRARVKPRSPTARRYPKGSGPGTTQGPLRRYLPGARIRRLDEIVVGWNLRLRPGSRGNTGRPESYARGGRHRRHVDARSSAATIQFSLVCESRGPCIGLSDYWISD
jgi:hypothetical protein